jgi:drug/metabolite transporter (DMT)-like permease
MILILAKLNIKLSAKLAQNQTLPEKMARIDWGGSFTLVSFLGALLVALSLKSLQELPWSSPWVAGLLVISVVFFALFIVVEKYWAKEPVLPMRLVMRRTPFFMAISSL